MAGEGRPTELNAQVLGVIQEAIHKGLPVRQACRLAGISHQTFYNWVERGKQGEAPFVDFLDAIEEARAFAQSEMLDRLHEASCDPKAWRAITWIMERQWPDDWGETLTVRVKTELARELSEFLAKCQAEMSPGAWDELREVAGRMERSAEHGAGDAPTRH